MPDTGATEQTAVHTGAIIGFKTCKGEEVHARVASSFISMEQAETNLRELENYSFDDIVAKGCERWNDVLGRIEITDEDIDHKRTFYSCLYRSLLFPRKFYEITANGEVMHYSPYNGEVLPGYMYTVFENFSSLISTYLSKTSWFNPKISSIMILNCG